jgi:hypothetical protein
MSFADRPILGPMYWRAHSDKLCNSGCEDESKDVFQNRAGNVDANYDAYCTCYNKNCSQIKEVTRLA